MRRFLLWPFLLLALLGGVAPAPASEAEEPDESGYVEETLEECEGDPVCLEEVEEEPEGDAEAATACPLRSAKGHAAIKRGKLKLTIGYTTNEPTEAKVQLHYGAIKLGSLKRHLGGSGVLRITKKLSGKPKAKPSAVRIELDPEGAGCPTRRLVLFPK
jgi:hypothetical protein